MNALLPIPLSAYERRQIDNDVLLSLHRANAIRTASAEFLRALQAFPTFGGAVEPIAGHELVDVIAAVHEWHAGTDPQVVAEAVEAKLVSDAGEW